MKPKNYEERKKAFVKFLLSGVLLLGIFGYGIYSYSYVHNDIEVNMDTSNSELKKLTSFIDKADDLVIAHDAADAQVEKNKYSVELNKYIIDEKSNFVSTATLFSRIEDNYRNLIKSKEVIVNIGEESKLNCDEVLKSYEKEIDDLKVQVEDSKREIEKLFSSAYQL